MLGELVEPTLRNIHFPFSSNRTTSPVQFPSSSNSSTKIKSSELAVHVSPVGPGGADCVVKDLSEAEQSFAPEVL